MSNEQLLEKLMELIEAIIDKKLDEEAGRDSIYACLNEREIKDEFLMMLNVRGGL